MINKNQHIVFICEPGELEVKSMLLACSLKQQNFNNLTVLIPSDGYSQVNRHTHELFNQLGVKVHQFRNLFLAKGGANLKGDRMSNKIYGLQSVEIEKSVLFLDSDIICLTTPDDIIFSNSFAAKPADFKPFANWDWLYNHLNITPTHRKVQTTVEGLECPPYFNSGVLWIKTDISSRLLEGWEHYFLCLSKQPNLNSDKFDSFHRDQLSLTMALESLKLEYTTLEENLNFPARRRNSIPTSTVFAHYHDVFTLRKHPQLLNQFLSFGNYFPQIEHVIKKHLLWRVLLKKQFTILELLHKKEQAAKRFKKILRK